MHDCISHAHLQRVNRALTTLSNLHRGSVACTVETRSVAHLKTPRCFVCSDDGLPWMASFRGCCRFAQLENNKDSEWLIAAQVDIGRAKASPRARILPVISVPWKPSGASDPKVVVPAADPDNKNAVQWSLATPWDVGNAAYFSRERQSFMSIPLQPEFNGDPLVPGFSEDQTLKACTADPASECNSLVLRSFFMNFDLS
jgi:hypothetical protein